MHIVVQTNYKGRETFRKPFNTQHEARDCFTEIISVECNVNRSGIVELFQDDILLASCGFTQPYENMDV
jgi:hypothetical protein